MEIVTGAFMGIVYWIFSQIISYPVAVWAGFIVLTFVVARWLDVPGVVLGHILIAIAIFALDFEWVQGEMKKPRWDGQPDMDFVFTLGVLVRILVFNCMLLPISLFALRVKRRKSAVAARV